MTKEPGTSTAELFTGSGGSDEAAVFLSELAIRVLLAGLISQPHGSRSGSADLTFSDIAARLILPGEPVLSPGSPLA
jgi:hypothetical protein